MNRIALLALCLSCSAGTAPADPGARSRLEDELSRYPLAGFTRLAIGVTRQDTPIPAVLSAAELDPASTRPRVLLVGGLDGDPASVAAVLKTAAALGEDPSVAWSLIPCARPGALGQAGGAAAAGFPPGGTAYHDPATDEAHYLWRWIGVQAPDLVIAVSGPGGSAAALVEALGRHAPAETGTIPARLVSPGAAADPDWAATLAGEVRALGASPARAEIRRRLARSPLAVAAELAEVYGRRLDTVAYIPAVAVIGRMRLGELTGDERLMEEAEALAEPYRRGEKASMGEKANGSNLSGHLLFSALAAVGHDPRDLALVRKAADYGFDPEGRPKESMPFHSEMSDSVFMGCAPLAEAAALTGESRYADLCLTHLRFMQRLCLREDGLYRHSPLDESAWGRGNGFPALGMTLSLSSLPEESAAHRAFLESYRAHLEALRRHQDPTGAWHQVIDRPESYREFTATSMIAFAIVRGIRRGWLDAAAWTPVAESAWTAVKTRIGPRGRLVDVCTGTGKMNRLRDYYDRAAILGPDDRGGAMALLIATEMASWERERKAKQD